MAAPFPRKAEFDIVYGEASHAKATLSNLGVGQGCTRKERHVEFSLGGDALGPGRETSPSS